MSASDLDLAISAIDKLKNTGAELTGDEESLALELLHQFIATLSGGA